MYNSFFECKRFKKGEKETISLLDNYAIGLSASLATHSPIDANNYVEVSDDTVTLHRNSGNPSLWIYTPQLEAGKTYVFLCEGATGNDGYLYRDFASTIPETGDIPTSRIGSFVYTGACTFTPGTTGHYAFVFWSNSGADIVVKDPRLFTFE